LTEDGNRLPKDDFGRDFYCDELASRVKNVEGDSNGVVNGGSVAGSFRLNPCRDSLNHESSVCTQVKDFAGVRAEAS
jgi:hypothetical protein